MKKSKLNPTLGAKRTAGSQQRRVSRLREAQALEALCALALRNTDGEVTAASSLKTTNSKMRSKTSATIAPRRAGTSAHQTAWPSLLTMALRHRRPATTKHQKPYEHN